MGVVWMQHNFKQLSTLAASRYSRSVSLAAFSLLVFFVVGGSDAATTLYCRVLQSGRGDGTIYAKNWVTWEDGGKGGVAGDVMVYPFLADLNAANNGLSYFQYWPKGYTQSNAPYVYAVKNQSGLNISIPDDRVDHIPEIYSALDAFTDAERACMNGLAITYPEGGGVMVIPTYTKPGTVVGNAVSTINKSGNHVLAYRDQTGFVSGYEATPQGTLSPVWYDTTGVSSGSQAVKLSSLNNSSSAQLEYDDTTSTYSFSIPDYSAQLSAINNSIDNLRLNPEITLNPNISLSPEITVEPSVTVNPTVTVPAPEVTVNVPAPEVTVNPTVTVPAPEVTVNVDNDFSEIVDTLDQLVESQYGHSITNDFSEESLTQEEQGLLNTANGWQTQIPVVGEAFDLGLNVLIGKIPQMSKSYDLLNLELWGYQVHCDLDDYKQTIMLFRAFFLLCELVWFFWVLWHDIMNALKV